MITFVLTQVLLAPAAAEPPAASGPLAPTSASAESPDPPPAVAPAPAPIPPSATVVATAQGQAPQRQPRFTPVNMAPLPPPPPPAAEETIETRPWRGTGWLSFRGLISGPVDGARNLPASTNATALGYSADIGYRPQPWIGLGIGVTQIAHDVDEDLIVDRFGRVRYATFTGNMTAWELLIIRGWFRGGPRVQPWVEVATGLATLRSASAAVPNLSGVHFRVGAGFDAWIAPRWSLDFGLMYRLINAGAAVGHTLGGTAGLTYHW